jgi:hypothetical protein
MLRAEAASLKMLTAAAALISSIAIVTLLAVI